MYDLILDLEAMPGSDIFECARVAWNLSKRFEITVEFMFNGVRCSTFGSSTQDEIVKKYWSAMKTKGPAHD